MTVEDGREVTIELDQLNEQVILAAALTDKADRSKLVSMISADHFLAPENAAAWTEIVLPMQKKGLTWDAATAKQLAGDTVDIDYLVDLVEARPTSPPNLDHHIAEMFWQRSKKTALEGPLNALIEALRDAKSEPERVIALARQLPATLGEGQKRYLCEPAEVVRQMMSNVRQRQAGDGIYPFGLPCLDYFESREAAKEVGIKVDEYPEGHRFRRSVPGTAPGKMTVVTAQSGAGKTTLLANIARALVSRAGRKRRVLIGAWEVDAPEYLQIIAGVKLNYSRTDLMEGRIDDEMMADLEKAATGFGRSIQFMKNPFYDGAISGKPSNERNLDIVAAHIADSGCDVFIGDLWQRCLVDDRPSDEARALYKQQSIFEQLRVHGIIATQQRKDVQLRPDKKPTSEGIKGSGAYTEVADTTLGVHRPSLWKRIEDTHLEIFWLKQRYGRWPLGVSIDHDSDTGQIVGAGKSIPYDLAGTSTSDFDGGFPVLQNKGRKKKKGD